MSRSTSRFLWVVLGLTGMGKTYLIEQMLGTFTKPTIIVDSTAEWEGAGRVYDTPRDLVDGVCRVLRGIDEKRGGVFVLRADRISKAEGLLTMANQTQLPGTYLVDEIHQYAGTHDTHDGVMNMIRMGRHAQQSIVGASQRAQAINKHLLEEAAITAFRQAGRGAERAAKEMGPNVTGADLQQLEEREFMNGGHFANVPCPVGETDGGVWQWDDAQGRCVEVSSG